MLTKYNDREYVNVLFLEKLGVVKDGEVFFNKVHEVNKLKVLAQNDLDILQRYADITDGKVRDFVVACGPDLLLCSDDTKMFEVCGYLNLVAKDALAVKIAKG